MNTTARFLLAATTVAAVGASADVARADYCTFDSYEKRKTRDLKFDGLANYGEVAPGRLYRGSQPFTKGQANSKGKRGNGFDTLKTLGVTCRILLREKTVTEEGFDEKVELAARGIRLIHLPVASPPFSHLPPGGVPASYTEELTRARDRFMTAVSDTANGKCYVGCLHGKDRTGALVGWYRAVVQGWKPKKIFAEQTDCKYTTAGPLIYYRRVFCGWYKERFGNDPDCAKVLKQ